MGGLACYRQKDLKEGHPDRYLQVSGVAHGEAESMDAEPGDLDTNFA